MLRFITRRLLLLIPTLIAISIVSFAIIDLPPGDYLTSYMATLAQNGETLDPAQLQAFANHYGLGQPVYVQYFKWMSGILLHGDFGQSMEWQEPVSAVIMSNLGLTLIISNVLLKLWHGGGRTTQTTYPRAPAPSRRIRIYFIRQILANWLK